jgi:hypothetical protein
MWSSLSDSNSMVTEDNYQALGRKQYPSFDSLQLKQNPARYSVLAVSKQDSWAHGQNVAPENRAVQYVADANTSNIGSNNISTKTGGEQQRE